MIHLSWRYFEQSGDPEGYLLYRDLCGLRMADEGADEPESGIGHPKEAEWNDSQNDGAGDPGD